MTKILASICIIAFSLTFVTCRKEIPFEQTNPADTLFPRSYLPIYPGSWWTYRWLADSTTFTDNASGYELASINYDHYNSEKYYVPVWRNRNYFGYGFSNENGSQVFTKEVEETLGASWLHESHPGDPRFSNWRVYRRVDSVGLSISVDSVQYNDVIKIIEWESSSGTTANWDAFQYYYAKDVGLIRMDCLTCSGNIGYYLIDYYISN